jgi:tRNA A58 N-methylase Trm61
MEKIKQHMLCSGMDCFANESFNDSLAEGADIWHLNYRGLSVEQNANIIYPFDSLIKSIKPSRVLEIGTFHGGLSLIIKDILNENKLNDSDVLTYDINHPEYVIDALQKHNIVIKTVNLFSDDYSDFRNDDFKNEISSFIRKDGVTLVLCDGGSKKNEFNIISKLLKQGDFIMAHDYSYSQEYFEQNIKHKYWNWCEINNDDIINSINANNLQSFMEEDFNKVGWTCKIKKI